MFCHLAHFLPILFVQWLASISLDPTLLVPIIVSLVFLPNLILPDIGQSASSVTQSEHNLHTVQEYSTAVKYLLCAQEPLVDLGRSIYLAH